MKSRYRNIGSVVNGVSSSEESKGAASWVELMLLGISERYELCNTYNAYETALFYETLPNHTLTLKGDVCTAARRVMSSHCPATETWLMLIGPKATDIVPFMGKHTKKLLYSGVGNKQFST